MLKNIIFVLLFSISSLFAIPQEQIKDTMNKKITEVLLTLKSTELTKDQKVKNVINIMDSSFDYKIMSRLSLGKKWKTLSKEDKSLFTKIFKEKLKNSYVEKLDLYTNQKIEIKNLEKVKSRLVLKTELLGEDENFKIDYKFYKNKKNQEWFIYDVDIIGVSIIQTYRKQFSEFLKTKSFTDLIELLKVKNTL